MRLEVPRLRRLTTKTNFTDLGNNRRLNLRIDGYFNALDIYYCCFKIMFDEGSSNLKAYKMREFRNLRNRRIHVCS